MPSTKHSTGGGPGARRAGAPPLPMRWALVALVAGAALSCAAPAEPPVSARTVLEGLSYSEFAGATLARRIHAEQAVVVPKRFGIFQVSALSELVLTRARVEVFEPAPGAAGPELRHSKAALDAVVPAEGAVPGLAELRRLAGATFHGLEVVVARGGAPLARVEAAHASADVRSGNLLLRDVQFEHLPSGRVIRTARATWRRRTSDFAIPGAYAIVEGGRTLSGRGLLVDGDFVARRP